MTPRRPPPPHLINDAAPMGFSPEVRLVMVDRERFARKVPEWLHDLRRASGGAPINILVLSGGGASGAFGAGALVGLSEAHTRPQFQWVTGASAGALLAPFAFLGESWDPQLRKAFDDDGIERLQRSPTFGFIGRLLFPLGVGNHDSLATLVDRFITDAMIDAVASESAKGRKLVIATTDLDSQETVLWNMGAIAQHGGSAAHELFRKVLVASASVPGVFPPVLIPVEEGGKVYDEMHVDGGITTPLFITPLIQQTVSWSGPELEGGSVYVIVNGQLAIRPVETPVHTLKILERSFSAQLSYKTQDALGLVYALTRANHMDFQLADIPAGYTAGSFLDFHQEHLHRLFDFGEGCAKQGLLWASVEQSLHSNFDHDVNDASCPAAVMQAAH